MSEYTEQAQRFIDSRNIRFRSVHVGYEINRHWGDGQKRNKYRITLFRNPPEPQLYGHASFTLRQSIADTVAGEQPTPYDLLACITKTDPGTFENFCSDFGLDTDSRKAEQTYKAVVKEWQKVRRFFTDAELEQLQEIA